MSFFSRILQNGDAEKDGNAIQNDAGCRDNRPRQTEFMHAQGALVFSATDGKHFADTGLDLAPEGRMWLDPVDKDQVIRLHDISRDKDFGPGGQMTEGDDIHGGSDRRADGGFGDAHVLEHLPLAVAGGPAVGAHGGDDDGFQPQHLEGGDDGRHHADDSLNTPGAHGDGDGLPRCESSGQIAAIDLAADRTGRIGFKGIIKYLFYLVKHREHHSIPCSQPSRVRKPSIKVTPSPKIDGEDVALIPSTFTGPDLRYRTGPCVMIRCRRAAGLPSFSPACSTPERS